jgi:phosphoribosyl 1,2-cyclic phosphodiesterase
MSFFFASLNSGSNGNCYCVGNKNDIVLIDGGISCKETEKRMLSIGLSLKKVKAVFVSHEHIDHVKGIEVLAQKHHIPVYLNEKTLKGAGNFIPKPSVKLFASGETIQIGELLIHSFSKMHDAADPISFVVEHNGLRIGVMTDIGKLCDNVINHFKQCNAVLLESNYDSNMLENGKYPYMLKKRISGDFGHLSNEQALDLFLNHKSQSLSHLMLGHLSQENNHPSLVQYLFSKNSVNTKISVASRLQPSEIIMIEEDGNKKAAPNSMMQLDLFD